MDKLETYLDQVCRSMGGPKSLRQHVRQELREHLLDAAAQHRAAGLAPEAALDRAVADFGGPDEVRAGLEEAHGHRLLPVLIDKAIQWKERTMRAKWLWMTWAHLALALVIVLEVVWITFANVFLVPKFQRLMQVGLIDPAVFERSGITWVVTFLEGLRQVGAHYTTWLLLLAIVACAHFEWRVHNENKSFIRLSAWGTIAVILVVPAIVIAGSLVIPYMLAAPESGKLARTFAIQQIATIDKLMIDTKHGLSEEELGKIAVNALEASKAIDELTASGPALGSLASGQGAPSMEALREQLKAAKEILSHVYQAANNEKAVQVEIELRKFREVYGPVRKEAGKP